jgi:hypothetical protein
LVLEPREAVGVGAGEEEAAEVRERFADEPDTAGVSEPAMDFRLGGMAAVRPEEKEW